MEGKTEAVILALWAGETPKVRTYLKRALRDADTAEDLTTQALIQVAAELDRGAVIEKPAAYLMRVAQHLLYKETKRREREQPSGLLTEMEPALESANTRPARPLPQSLASFPPEFDSALRALPGPERDAFILTELRGLTTREAGEVLGVNQSTVVRRHGRALERVRKGLSR